MATDLVGLEVLQNARCFDCYATWHEAKMKGELQSQAVTACLPLKFGNAMLALSCQSCWRTTQSVQRVEQTVILESKHSALDLLFLFLLPQVKQLPVQQC